MGRENPTWGEERIANELLLKLGIQVSPRTVRKYLPPRPPGRLLKRRISQVPGESIPYLCPALRSRLVHRPSPYRPDDAAPTLPTVKSPAERVCRDSITRLQYPLPTLHVMRCRTPCKARFRLVVSLCRVGVEPTGLHRKVSVRYIELPPFLGLSWR